MSKIKIITASQDIEMDEGSISIPCSPEKLKVLQDSGLFSKSCGEQFAFIYLDNGDAGIFVNFTSDTFETPSAEICKKDFEDLGFVFKKESSELKFYEKESSLCLIQARHFFNKQYVFLTFSNFEDDYYTSRKFDCQYKWQLETVLRRHNLLN